MSTDKVRSLAVYPLDQRPELIGAANALIPRAWAPFMLEDDVGESGWPELNRRFLAFQLVICTEGDTVIALGNTIPLSWNRTLAGLPTGFDGALLRGIAGNQSGQPPNTLCALGATIDPGYQGRGISRMLLEAMRDLATRHGFPDLIAPVRPTQKSRYPLTPMENYIRWRLAGEAEAPFDPWLRTHWRLGAQILQVEPRSMVVSGKVAEWEEWAAMRFPETGRYVVPGALEPVAIDRENDLGRYIEANVWMRHTLSG